MKTTVYIDGFNLYYGRLRYTPYKWLDLYKLFSHHLLKPLSPETEQLQIKFFTSNVKSRFSRHGQTAQIAQQIYHRALTTLYPTEIDIIHGFHSVERVNAYPYQPEKKPDHNDKIRVWKIEEKQTDVNIALHLFEDAILQRCQRQVIVSNDTDLEPALSRIRNHSLSVEIGIVIPVPKPSPQQTRRPPNTSLSRYADWTRSYITNEELAASFLPERIPTRKKPLYKPEHW